MSLYAAITTIGLMLLVTGFALLVLRAYGRIGPHRDIAEHWSVRSPEAQEQARHVAAQVQALRVEAGVIRRDYRPPARKEVNGAQG